MRNGPRRFLTLLPRAALLVLAAFAGLQCRPGILYDGAPTDECFCGTFSAPQDGGGIELILQSEAGTLVAAIALSRDLPGYPWDAFQFQGEVTAPGMANGEATVFLGDSEIHGESVEAHVPLQLELLPTRGACAERSTLQLELSYLDLSGEQREESYSLERDTTCPDDE